MKFKKIVKRLLIIFILPLIIFILMGLFQGVSQLSYHSDLIRSLESYRTDVPYCFIYFTPPNGNEEVKRVIGTYQLDDEHQLVFAENDISSITVNLCQTKEHFGKQFYKTLSIYAVFNEDTYSKESCDIDYNDLSLSVEMFKENPFNMDLQKYLYTIEYGDCIIAINHR